VAVEQTPYVRPVRLIALGFASALVVMADARALGAAPTTSVAWAGTLLQVLGLGTVATGITRLRRAFQPQHPGVFAQALAAFRARIARLFGKRPVFIGQAHLTVEPAAIKITGFAATLVHRAGPGASPERRLDILEQEVENLREEYGRDLPEVRAGLARLDDAVARERAERTTADAGLGATVEDLAAGGLDLQTVGLCWLLGGVVLGTVPGPIATAVGFVLGVLR